MDSIELRDSHGCELNESQEGGSELVVAGSDATELLELVEEAFNVVALAIDSFGPAEALFAPDHVGNVGDGAARFDVSPQAIGIVSLVGDNDCVLAEVGQKGVGAG